MKNNEVTNFMFYVYNKWNINEAHLLFGKNLGDHIFNKWVGKREYSHDQTMSWFGDLDKKCRQKIVDRANELYNK